MDNSFDHFVNKIIAPTSVQAGVGTVLLTMFSSKIGPKIPDQYLKLLDNLIVKIILVAFMINQQIKKPTNAVVISIALVGGLTLLIHIFAPGSPSVSELVKPAIKGASGEEESHKEKACNCYCNSTILTGGSETPEGHIKGHVSAPPNAFPSTQAGSFWQSNLDIINSHSGRPQQKA